MSRPIVLVYQELANPSIVTTAPDQATCIVGPSYVVKDYPDDAAEILLDDAYGLVDQPADTFFPGSGDFPAVGTTIISLSNYPGNEPGAIVDKTGPADHPEYGVRVFLRNPRIVIGGTASSSVTGWRTLGTGVTTTSSSGLQNQITFNGTPDLVAAGVKPGDLIYLSDSAGEDIKRTVLSVGEGGSNHILRVTANLPASGWTFDGSGHARIEHIISGVVEFTDSTGTYINFPDVATNELNINGGIVLPYTYTYLSGSTTVSATVSRLVSYAQVYVSYRALRQDLQNIDSVTVADLRNDGTGLDYFLKVGKVDPRNPLAVGLYAAIQNSGNTPISFYGVSSNGVAGHAGFRDAVSSRRDIYTVVPLTTDQGVLNAYRAEFDQVSDATYAVDNGVLQKFRMLIGSAELPTASVISAGSAAATVSQDAHTSGKYRKVSILTAAADITALAGIPKPGDRLIIGITPSASGWSTRRGTHTIAHVNSSTVVEVIPGNSSWVDSSGNTADTVGHVGTEILIETPGGVTRYAALAQLSETQDDGVLTPAVVLFKHRRPVTTGSAYQVRFVAGAPSTATTTATLSGNVITVTLATVGGAPVTATVQQAVNAINANPQCTAVISATITSGNASSVAQPFVATSLALTETVSNVSILATDAYYELLTDASATFLTDGVQVGDVIEIPVNPNDAATTAFNGSLLSYTVGAVVSENRLRIASPADDTALVAKELPYGFARNGVAAGGSGGVVDTAAVRYRVRRLLTKDNQVTALVALAQSYSSKRVTMVWPDRVTVIGLKDGSLTRSNSAPLVAAPATSQPGYYLAALVGGAAAALPPQHGLTNLGLGGVRIEEHSSNYFTDRQLSMLSDGGWFVMQQLTPESLPYCIHQLTTNPTALETGEFSVVRTVDFNSLFLQRVLEPFIGVYNVTDESLGAVSLALRQGIDSLKLRKVARIGAPVLSGEVTSVQVSEATADRLEVYVTLRIPRPLNTIGLHLVV